jgi:hypothetical protein
MGIGKNKLYAVQVRVQSILCKVMHLCHGLHRIFPQVRTECQQMELPKKDNTATTTASPTSHSHSEY